MLKGRRTVGGNAEAVLEEADLRRINRKTIKKRELLSALEDENSNIYQISSPLVRLIYHRIRQKAFHPNADQRVLDLSERVFSVLRTSVDRKEKILALINITDQNVNLQIDLESLSIAGQSWFDILTKRNFESDKNRLDIELDPYEIIWLKQK